MESNKKTTIEKTVHRLIRDCGWKNKSCFRCGVCSVEMFDIIYENENYNKCRPRMIEHIINEHPEYCYRCNKCPMLFTTKKDLKCHRH